MHATVTNFQVKSTDIWDFHTTVSLRQALIKVYILLWSCFGLFLRIHLRKQAKMQVPLFRLQCGCNSYDWGKKGNTSAAAKYAAATPRDDFSIQEDKPYAEVQCQSTIS